MCSLPLDDDDDDDVRAHGRRLGSCANYTDSYVNRLIETLDPIVQELRSKDMLKHAYIYGFDENLFLVNLKFENFSVQQKRHFRIFVRSVLECLRK